MFLTSPGVAVQLLSRVRLFATPWTTESQASLSFTVSQSLLNLMSIELMMLSNHLILFHLLFFLPQSLLASRSFSMSQLFAIPWSIANQAPLSFTSFWSLLKLTSVESMMPSNHFVLHCPLSLLPSIFPSIRAFSNKSALCITWSKD